MADVRQKVGLATTGKATQKVPDGKVIGSNKGADWACGKTGGKVTGSTVQKRK